MLYVHARSALATPSATTKAAAPARPPAGRDGPAALLPPAPPDADAEGPTDPLALPCEAVSLALALSVVGAVAVVEEDDDDDVAAVPPAVDAEVGRLPCADVSVVAGVVSGAART